MIYHKNINLKVKKKVTSSLLTTPSASIKLIFIRKSVIHLKTRKFKGKNHIINNYLLMPKFKEFLAHLITLLEVLLLRLSQTQSIIKVLFKFLSNMKTPNISHHHLLSALIHCNFSIQYFFSFLLLKSIFFILKIAQQQEENRNV